MGYDSLIKKGIQTAFKCSGDLIRRGVFTKKDTTFNIDSLDVETVLNPNIVRYLEGVRTIETKDGVKRNMLTVIMIQSELPADASSFDMFVTASESFRVDKIESNGFSVSMRLEKISE